MDKYIIFSNGWRNTGYAQGEAMIDTIKLKYRIKVAAEHISSWAKATHEEPNGRRYRKYTLNVRLDNGAMVKFTYFPASFDKLPLFMIEFSLTKVVYGNNIINLVDFEDAIDRANEIIAAILYIPKINLWEGVLQRLDICYNFKVGRLVSHYIKALQNRDVSRRKTKPYLYEGVIFYSKKAMTKFYDKLKESKNDPTAKGILRMEVTRIGEAVKKLTNKEKPTLRDVTPELVIHWLEAELQRLEILGKSIGTYDNTLGMLCDAFGRNKGSQIFAVLKAKQEYPNLDAIAEAIGCSRRTLQRKLKKLSDAGIAPTLTQNSETLPPLTIDKSILNKNSDSDEQRSDTETDMPVDD